MHLSKGHALFGDRVIPRPGRPLLKRQSVERSIIEQVNRGRAVEPVADISRNTLLASERDQKGDEALLVCVMDNGVRDQSARGRKPDGRGISEPMPNGSTNAGTARP